MLLDALIIRSLLVPALMFKFGEANWKLPGSLDKLIPHLRVEGAATRIGGRRLRVAEPASGEASAS